MYCYNSYFYTENKLKVTVMNTKYIRKITFYDFTDIILSAKEELIISMPSIHEDMCDLILSRNKELENISVIIDNSEENYRNGYGAIDGISKMKEKGIKIYNLTGNFVSFIIADKAGWYIFPQSRIFTGEDTTGLNAAAINRIDILLLKSYFLNEQCYEEEYEQELFESITEAKQDAVELMEELNIQAPLELKELKDEELKDMEEKLRKNPPINPDLRRKLTTYKAKIQFAEFSFEGAHLNSVRVKIPKAALPINDDEFKRKLLATMKLFDDIMEAQGFRRFTEFKDKVENLRKKYLIPLTSRKGKSIIKCIHKEEFKREFDMLQIKLKNLNSELVEIIQTEILKSKDRIKKILMNFLEKNVPDDITGFKGDLWSRTIADRADVTASRIKFPNHEKILGRMRLNLHIYDLTYEDFSDKELHKEFESKKIMAKVDINDIVKFTDAVEVKAERKNDANMMG